MFKNRSVLVAGGTGLIGRPLVEMLLERGAKVRVVSLDDASRAPAGSEFQRLDLTDPAACAQACDGIEFVFQLCGVKGSPAVSTTRPASFITPTVLFSFHLLEAARRCGVKRYLFTSSIAVYSPAEVLREDDVWSTFPSPNDRVPGWAKRLCELQVESYRVEYGWEDLYIVRPANTYGPYDNFDLQNAMVVPSIVRRAVDGENPLVVWGDGSARRDFIHARDVAAGMLTVFEQRCSKPVNLGSGVGTSIRELVDVVTAQLDSPPRVEWDTSKPRGDAMRVMDMTRARALGIAPSVSLEAGIRETIDWYAQNRQTGAGRYDVFR
ncbi:MAG: NAD-dependent epimerase/dehydratase family protein [Proteobacteria bacterium]|nr:NAD-dependent epimerase/dehydratase family protein [Pseudomonadota bacterium]